MFFSSLIRRYTDEMEASEEEWVNSQNYYRTLMQSFNRLVVLGVNPLFLGGLQLATNHT